MRVFGMVFLLLAASAWPALAQHGSVRLMWTNCGAAGTTARTFACNTNSGSDVLILSFKPGNATDAVYQFETSLSIGYQDFSLMPDWWSLAPVTGCRRGALTASAGFSSAGGACEDPWAGQGLASVAVTQLNIMDGGLRRLRVNVVAALPFAAASPLDPATEYFAARLTLNHQKTTGTGACAGCAQSMCIAFNSSSSYTLANPDSPTRTALWTDFGESVVWNGTESCERLVPVRNSTWGAIKSLYR